MKQFIDTNQHILTIERGEELIAQLVAYAHEHRPNSAWLSGLGGTDRLTLGFYDLPSKDYEWHEYDEPLEILSLTGNLSWVDGEPFWHVHGTFSGRDMKAFGGHVKSLNVSQICEVMITPHSTPLTRAYDEVTGLKLLSSEL